MIPDVENNCMQNKCKKWIKHKNDLPNMGASAIEQRTEIYLHAVDMRGMKIQPRL